MYEIFAFIGSRNHKNSFTWKITKDILEKTVLFSKGTIRYEIYTADELEINHCQGCLNCFANGFCPLDKKDAMEQMKEKMIKADMIIWGSPVFAHNISASMKDFIDRIAYWTHLFRLAGKYGMTVSTGTSNGFAYVNGYLNKIMQFCGMQVIYNMQASTVLNVATADGGYQNLDLEPAARLLKDTLQSKPAIKVTEQQEQSFQYIKQSFLMNKEYEPKMAEYRYWEEHGYLTMDSYYELLSCMHTGTEPQPV